MDILNKLLKERNNFDGETDHQWIIRESNIGGRGIFAVKDIPEGEIIFKDIPTVIGPRASDDLPRCAICMVGERPLTACPEGCRLPVCYGRHCEQFTGHRNDCKLLRQLTGVKLDDPGYWSPQLYKMLGLLRCLIMPQKETDIIKLLYASKGKETEIQMEFLKRALPNGLSESDESWLFHCCGVLDGTAFEIPHNKTEGNWSLRGLYPLAAMMNHCCSPNTRHNYSVGLDIEEGGGPIMSVIASANISKDTEITTTYCPQLWSTPARREFLFMTKQFLCNCYRCQDPTEFGTNLSALKCSCHNGILLPGDSLEMSSPWICSSCSGSIEARKALAIQTAASKITLTERKIILPLTNYLIVQIKLETVWKASENISSLSNAELTINENNIKDLLVLLKKLHLGKSRMSGLLLLELFKTINELIKRNLTGKSEKLTKIWTEANAILDSDLNLLTLKTRRH